MKVTDSFSSASNADTASESTEHAGASITIIEPPHGWQLINIHELWRFRELVYFLIWRDVKVRYKQTLLGAAWAILQPVMMMVVFTIFFGRMAGVPSGGMPYPLFVYAGLLPWTFFATAITNAGNSVVGSERLITKVYFPRLAVPIASVGAAVVDFGIAFGLLLAMMLYYKVTPGLGMLLVPVISGLIVLAALGAGTLLAALNVAYRDFRYVIPFMVQLGLFATPTVYMDPGADTVSRPVVASDRVSLDRGSDPDSAHTNGQSPPEQRSARRGGLPPSLKALLFLNPMIPLVGAFRAATLGGPMPWPELPLAVTIVGLVLLIGCLYFRKVEDSFADII